MGKEFKILFTAILTQVLYGVFLLIDGKPFYISPLNALVNLFLTIAIIISLKKYDWRNYLVLGAACISLLRDPLFLSFFSIPVSFKDETYQVLAYTTIFTSSTLCFIAMLQKRKMKWNILVVVTLILSILSFVLFGIYGSFAVTTAGLLLVLLSPNEEIEFLKIYWMFFTFMLLNHVVMVTYNSV